MKAEHSVYYRPKYCPMLYLLILRVTAEMSCMYMWNTTVSKNILYCAKLITVVWLM
jgi:hypothetical protein